MSFAGRICCTVLVCLCLVRSTSGQLTDADRSRLSDQIESAATNLDPDRLPQLERAMSEVQHRIDRAKNFFARKTSAENFQAWMDYLKLDPLAESIATDQSPAAIGREALELRYRLIGTAPGLELTVLRRLRTAVERLIAAVRFRDPQRSVEALSRQLESLAERVRGLDSKPSPDDHGTISVVIDILNESGQATEVVRALQSTFGRPNAAVLVGQSMVQTAISQNVNQTTPVNDCILGTRIIGTATMTGTVDSLLLPASGAARIQVALRGNVFSNNTGYNGPVRLYTTGYGNVYATRTLSVNESGLILDPVQVSAHMRTQINHIQPKRKLGSRLVKKIARKRAAQQKPQTDAIANYKFRTQVAEQFASQTSEQAGLEIPDFMRDVRPMLARLSLAEPLRLWGSSATELYIDATVRCDNQMTTVVSRPAISGPYAAAVQLHESAINNAATPILAGRTVSESQLTELMKAVGREIPAAEAADEEESQPFEISFARLRPVIFEARDQTIRVGVRGTRFAQGSRELNRAMEITATYRPERREDGSVILVRVDEVGVTFPGGRKRLSVSQAGLKATIQKKFSNIFPATLLDRPLEVPQTAKLAAIRGRSFTPRTVEAENGWLTIAVN